MQEYTFSIKASRIYTPGCFFVYRNLPFTKKIKTKAVLYRIDIVAAPIAANPDMFMHFGRLAADLTGAEITAWDPTTLVAPVRDYVQERSMDEPECDMQYPD